VKALSIFLFSSLLFMTQGNGQELDQPLRAQSANGRILILAEEGTWLTHLSKWSERSLERLEDQWKRKVPIPVSEPLQLVMGEGPEEVMLGQGIRNGVLRQRISIPSASEKVGEVSLSERLVEAMTVRLLWSERGNLTQRPKGVPLAWAKGAARSLIEHESARLAEQAIDRYQAEAPPFPELVQGENELDSFLLYRWMLDTALADRRTSARFWEVFHANPGFTEKEWVQVTPGVSSLRELHIAWDVWWSAKRQMLLSEYRLAKAAKQWLMIELTPIPRFLGIPSKEESAFVPMSFEEYERFLDLPNFDSALLRWMFRLQAVRFRQPADLNADIQAFEKALHQGTQASRSGKLTRKARWDKAVEMWDEAISDL